MSTFYSIDRGILFKKYLKIWVWFAKLELKVSRCTKIITGEITCYKPDETQTNRITGTIARIRGAIGQDFTRQISSRTEVISRRCPTA